MLNNCLILGWVKFEPDAKVMKNGKEVCTLEIQCARQYRDKDNKRVYDYISCRCFVPGLIKYISNFVTKGSQTALLRQMPMQSRFMRILFDTVI